jgi:hypothetical protein
MFRAIKGIIFLRKISLEKIQRIINKITIQIAKLKRHNRNTNKNH